MESIADQIKKKMERKFLLTRGFTPIDDFLKKELPPNKWVAENLIPEGLTILSSAPGQFKTYMLLGTTEQISMAEKVMGHFEAKKRGVLFINEEMGQRAIQDRMKLLPGEYGNFYISNLIDIEISDTDIILEFCKEKDITLVVFDSLTRIHNLKENDADDVKKIFKAIKVLLVANISVILTHHHRKAPMFGAKNGSDEMRGSTDILAQVDCHLMIDSVAPDKSYLTLLQPKIRISEGLPAIKIGIIFDKDNSISFKYRGKFSKMDEMMEKIQECKEAILKVIEENPGITKDKIFVKVAGKVGQATIKSVLPELEKDGVIRSMGNKPKMYYINESFGGLI